MGFLEKKQVEAKPEVVARPNVVDTPDAKAIEVINEDKVVEDKKEVKHRIMVVKELPTEVIRQTEEEDGTILHFITVEEALTESINQ